MNKANTIQQEEQILVICRIESGCLGPQGREHVVAFCDFIKDKFATPDLHFIQWEVVPREGLKFPELEYRLHGKRLLHDHAEKYLSLFNTEIKDFEDYIDDKIIAQIEQYFLKTDPTASDD